jgi:hypothetical protein
MERKEKFYFLKPSYAIFFLHFGHTEIQTKPTRPFLTKELGYCLFTIKLVVKLMVSARPI